MRPSTPTLDPRSARAAVTLGLTGAASFALVGAVYAVSAFTVRGQEVENAVLGGRRDQLEGGLSTAAEILARISVWSLVATIAGVMALALARRRPRLALTPAR